MVNNSANGQENKQPLQIM